MACAYSIVSGGHVALCATILEKVPEIKAIANKEKVGDVSTLEDGAAVTEVQSAFDELQKSVNSLLKSVENFSK